MEYIYLGTDNRIDLLLKSDDVAQDLSGVTRITLDFNGTVVDSAISSGAFSWPTATTGELQLTLGDESIPIGRYTRSIAVIVTLYDAVNTDGIVWDTFDAIVD